METLTPGMNPYRRNTCPLWKIPEEDLVTDFVLAELCPLSSCRSPDPAIKCIMGGTDQDGVQSCR